jgi:hypothetical protein
MLVSADRGLIQNTPNGHIHFEDFLEIFHCKHCPAFRFYSLIKSRMAVIFERDNCKLIRHDRQLFSFTDDSGAITKYQLDEILFNNFRRKQKFKASETSEMKSQVESFLKACENIFQSIDIDKQFEYKQENIELMNKLYAISND